MFFTRENMIDSEISTDTGKGHKSLQCKRRMKDLPAWWWLRQAGHSAVFFLLEGQFHGKEVLLRLFFQEAQPESKKKTILPLWPLCSCDYPEEHLSFYICVMCSPLFWGIQAKKKNYPVVVLGCCVHLLSLWVHLVLALFWEPTLVCRESQIASLTLGCDDPT